MSTYIVLYRKEGSPPLDAPMGLSFFTYRCEADDPDHAEEKCREAYPGCDVMWVVQTSSLDFALGDYYHQRKANRFPGNFVRLTSTVRRSILREIIAAVIFGVIVSGIVYCGIATSPLYGWL